MTSPAKKDSAPTKALWPLLEDQTTQAPMSTIQEASPVIWDWLQEATNHEPEAQIDIWATIGNRLNPYQYQPRHIEYFEMQQFTDRYGQTYAIIRNPEQNSYIRLSQRDLFIWNKLDGAYTTRDIAVAYVLQYGAFNFEGITHLLTQLQQKGFLQESNIRVYHTIGSWLEKGHLSTRLRRLVQAFFLKDFSLRRIDAFLGRLYHYFFWVCLTRPGALLLHLLVIVGLTALGYQVSTGQHNPLDLGPSPILRLLALGLLSQVAVFFHETAHGVTCKHYGRTVRRGGVLIYLGRLAFFVDTTDIWMVSRWPRIAVSWAGPLAHMVMGSIAILAVTFLNLSPEMAGLVYQYAILMFLIGFFNLNPLLELDGYYMLMDYLEIPNLRRRALAFIRRPFWLKLKGRQRLSGEEWGFAFFGVLTALYTGLVIVAAISLWQKRIAKPLALLLGEIGAQWAVGLLFMLIVVIAFWPHLQAFAVVMRRRIRGLR